DVRRTGTGEPELAAAAARRPGPAGLRHAGGGHPAGGDALGPGPRPAPAPVRRLAAHAAATDPAGIADVPQPGCRLRAAGPGPADRRALRRRPLRPAPGAQDGAVHPVLGRPRHPPLRPLALGLARAAGSEADPAGDGAAAAGLLWQQVRIRVGVAAGVSRLDCCAGASRIRTLHNLDT